MKTDLVHDELAELLRYPDYKYVQRLERCQLLLGLDASELTDKLRLAHDQIELLSLEQMEELFTSCFDLNPVCSLEVGWHLFGENYDRGALMARLRRELSAHGVRENGELPDHLTQIMPLLGRMEHDEAADFYAACVAPALARMRAAFQASSNNPFAVILDGICRW